MFLKLLKNEILVSYKDFLKIYFLSAITIFVLGMSRDIGIFQFNFENFMLIRFCALIITIFIIITNYNKSMFSDSAYFFQSLPVKKRVLFLSKITVALIWIIGLDLIWDLGIAAILLPSFNKSELTILGYTKTIGITTARGLIFEILLRYLKLGFIFLLLFLSFSIPNISSKRTNIFTIFLILFIGGSILVHALFYSFSAYRMFNTTFPPEISRIVFTLILSVLLFGLNVYILEKHIEIK